MSQNKQGLTQLELLFPENSLVYFDYSKTIINPATGEKEKKYIPCDFEQAQYFVLNPVKNYDNRKASNLKLELFNFLFEFDKSFDGMPEKETLEKNWLEEQRTKLTELNELLPFRAITYSGNKSYHAIVSLQIPIQGKSYDSVIERYIIIWKSLAAFIKRKTGLEADEHKKNPAGLTRLAGATRENGVEQTLFFTGGLCSEDVINCICTAENITLSKKSEKVPAFDYPSLTHLELKVGVSCRGIYTKIKNTKFNHAAGNHHEIFSLATWLCDATGCSYELNSGFLMKHVWPRLQEVSYPMYKMEQVFYRLKNYKY